MPLTTRTGHVGELGFDTVERFDTEKLASLKALGFSFGGRYVETLDAAEVEAFSAQQMGLFAIAYARTSGWSERTGAADGAEAAHRLLSAGLPAETDLYCDLEGGVPSEDVAVAYCNAWWTAATAAGAKSTGVYVGAGSGFSSADSLFHKLAFKKYWRSMSQVPNVAIRGYQLVQLYPPNQRVAGVQIDCDVVQADYLGGLPNFAIAA